MIVNFKNVQAKRVAEPFCEKDIKKLQSLDAFQRSAILLKITPELVSTIRIMVMTMRLILCSANEGKL